jgi:thymidylate kinase
MVIILEGCDCVGKTTFAEELARQTGYEVIKGSSFEISQLGADGMYKHMSDLLDRDNIIIDRFYLSNYVYGNLYNYPTMSDLQFEKLAIKTDFSALTIYLTASEDTIKYRMSNRGDDMIKTDEVTKILGKYEEGIRNYNTGNRFLLRFDTGLSITNTELTVSMVTAFINNAETSTFIKYRG